MERRCVVRIELASRCVAVRCRAARRLRHVLRPVLAKYAHTHPHRAVLRDGVLLHPDTVMQVRCHYYYCGLSRDAVGGSSPQAGKLAELARTKNNIIENSMSRSHISTSSILDICLQLFNKPFLSLQELDGARLQIVDVSENGEYRASAGDPPRDDDADSLSDLAVRLQDDALRQQDEQVNYTETMRTTTSLLTVRRDIGQAQVYN